MKNANMIFEELSHIAYMVKESNSTVNVNLVYEGFWNTVGSKIGKFGADARNLSVSGYNKVMSGVDFVKELGQKTWDKIVSLGEAFVEWVKMVKTKVEELLNIIKGTPAKIWESMKSFYTWLLTEIGNKIEQIKTGWDIFLFLMNKFIFEPIADFFKNVIIDTEANYAYYKAISLDDLKSLKDFANESKNKGSEKWNQMMTSISKLLNETLPKTAEGVLEFLKGMGKQIIMIGLVFLPFALAFKALGFNGVELLNNIIKLGDKLIKKGEELLFKLLDKLYNTISSKVNVYYYSLLSDKTKYDYYKANYAKAKSAKSKSGYNGEQQLTVKESSRTILSFDDFLRRK
jgi:hypothetical protein